MPLGNPIDHIERAHARQARLCDELEQIADTLPDQVDPALCDTVTQILLTELPLHRRDEEQALFPLLEKRALPEDNVERHLSQLCMEHATDEGVAAELLELLPSLTDGERLHEPNMFGYMLRSFFECYRRHLIWEQNLILPLARERLGRVDLVTLAELMADHRRTRPFQVPVKHGAGFVTRKSHPATAIGATGSSGVLFDQSKIGHGNHLKGAQHVIVIPD